MQAYEQIFLVVVLVGSLKDALGKGHRLLRIRRYHHHLSNEILLSSNSSGNYRKKNLVIIFMRLISNPLYILPNE